MLSVRPTSRFKKDLRKGIRQDRNLKLLQHILQKLSIPEPLPSKYNDHKLKGQWRDFRECHIDDWLLIYTITDFELRPTRLGSHSELFE